MKNPNLFMKQKFLVLILLLAFSFSGYSQSDFTIRIQNEQFINDTTYQFDIYYYSNSSNTTWEHGSTELTMNVSTSFYNASGTKTFTLVGSDFLATDGPLSSSLTFQDNVTNYNLKVQSTTFDPTVVTGTTINFDGKKFGTFRIINSTGFVKTNPANLYFQFDNASLNTVLKKVNGSRGLDVLVSKDITNTVCNIRTPVYANGGTSYSGYYAIWNANGSVSYASYTTNITSIALLNDTLDLTVVSRPTWGGTITNVNVFGFSQISNTNNTLIIASGCKLNVMGHLAVMRQLSFGNNTSAVYLKGTRNQEFFALDQTNLNCLYFSDGNKNLNNSIAVIYNLYPVSGSFYSNGKLSLGSATSNIICKINNSSGTNGEIYGTVTVRRYIPGGKRAYRIISSPFSTGLPVKNIQQNTFITGPGTVAGTPVLGTTKNSNGFDYSPSGNPSAFIYNHTIGNTTQTQDPGWQSVATINDTIKDAGALLVLIRGDRSQTTALTGGNPTPLATTLYLKGTLNKLNSNTITKTFSVGTNSKYVLIGNPYWSEIDLNLTTRTNLTNFCYYWNLALGVRGGYSTLDMTSTNCIFPSGSGFFVRVSDGFSSGSIEFTKSCLSSSTFSGGTLFKNQKSQITVKLFGSNDSIFWDEFNLVNNSGASEKFENSDAEKLMNPDLSLFSINSDGKNFAVDSRKFESATINLGFKSNIAGRYTFDFSNSEFSDEFEYYFKDSTSIIPISKDLKYDFNVEVTKEINVNRFSIIIKDKANGILENTDVRDAIIMYPNPASNTNKIYLSINSAMVVKHQLSEIEVYDSFGKLILSENATLSTEKSHEIDVANLCSGVYYVKISGLNYSTVMPFIK